MKHLLIGIACLFATTSGAGTEEVKVFISVDMEGTTSLVLEDEYWKGRHDYERFRGILTRETNAAVEGAFAAGATDVMVRDGHGGMNHLLPELLDRRALLVRGPSHPQSMMVGMEGFDKSVDAVVLIAYHARAGYPDSVFPHTMTENVEDVRINGEALSEAGYSALIAGKHDVPVVMLSGDQAACDDATETLGNIETVAVKKEINGAIISLHPAEARDRIRKAVETGVRNRSGYTPYKLNPPFTMTLKLKEDRPLIEGAHKNDDGKIVYESDDLFETLHALVYMW